MNVFRSLIAIIESFLPLESIRYQGSKNKGVENKNIERII